MFLLPQIVDLTKATEMLMLGTQIEAEQAVNTGLANPDDFLRKVRGGRYEVGKTID